MYGKRLSNPPSLYDILPNGIVRRSPSNNIQELLGNSTQDDSKETLDGDETENVDSYYEDYDFEGNSAGCYLFKNRINLLEDASAVSYNYFVIFLTVILI